MNETIKINKTILFSREQAKAIAKAIRKRHDHKIYIDFSEVNFVSRAFADEWLNVVENLDSKKTILVRHLSPDVKKMIQVVRRKKKEIRKQLS